MAPSMAPPSRVANMDTFIDDFSSFEQENSMFSSGLFTRQTSAPVRLSKGLFTRQVSAPVHHLPIREESANSLSEPEWEPEEDDLDLDPFQAISAPVREISDFSTKAPSRQVSSQDWEPIGVSSIKRQSTDEQWPTWHGKDPLSVNIDSQFNMGAVSYGSEELANPYLNMNMWAPPPKDVDVNAMTSMFPQLYIWQLPPPQKQQDTAVQSSIPFQRKRESLIDLAKQRQEEEAASHAASHATSQESGAPPSGVKFCPWCGGSYNPNFKFCVFCGQQFSARTNNA